MDKDINVKLGAVGMASDPSLDLPPQIEACTKSRYVSTS